MRLSLNSLRHRRWPCGGSASRQSRRSVAELRRTVSSSELPKAVVLASSDDGALPLISSGREWTSFVIKLSEECVILFDDDATQRCLYPDLGHAASAHLYSLRNRELIASLWEIVRRQSVL